MTGQTPAASGHAPDRRPKALQGFLDALQAAFLHADLAPEARRAVDRVFAAAAQPAPAGQPPSEDLPITALLPSALTPLLGRRDALGELARALIALGPHLRWSRRKVVGPTASPGFAEAHANAYLLGPGGIEARGDVWVGLSLMAAGTRYPDHDHAPEEVYLVLTPGEFWHGDAAWTAPGVGGTVYNSPGIRHAMRAAEQPFLAVWVLPV
ncbi:MAG: dimethylsulfonioproprionate lyase family protein [Paracoccaceae bacterium]